MLNIGIALMALPTLLPLGTLQLFAAIEKGYWYARSAEFMHEPLVDQLVWLRMIGDTVFSTGAVALAVFVVGLWVFRAGKTRKPPASKHRARAPRAGWRSDEGLPAHA